jgi:hypothetical protein
MEEKKKFKSVFELPFDRYKHFLFNNFLEDSMKGLGLIYNKL